MAWKKVNDEQPSTSKWKKVGSLTDKVKEDIKDLFLPDIAAKGIVPMPMRFAEKVYSHLQQVGQQAGQGIGVYAEHHDPKQAMEAMKYNAEAPEGAEAGFYAGRHLLNPVDWATGFGVNKALRAVGGKVAGKVAGLTEAEGSTAAADAARAAEVIASNPYETFLGTGVKKLGEKRSKALEGKWFTPKTMSPLREELKKGVGGNVEGGSLTISPRGVITNNTGINPAVVSKIKTVDTILRDKGGLTAQQVQEAISLLETKAFDVALTPTEEALLKHTSILLSKKFQQMLPEAGKFTEKMSTQLAAQGLKGRPNLSAMTDIGKSWFQPLIKQGTRAASMGLTPLTPITGAAVENPQSLRDTLMKTLGGR